MRFVSILVLTLGGCAALQPLVNPVDAIVAEAVTAARAPAAEQAAALGRAEKEATRPGAGPIDLLRLGTLLATVPPPLRDDARAVELLAPLADPGSPGIGRFAALLAAQVGERQRVARERERTDKERAHVDKERAHVDKERERLDKERDKREEALKQQLDALRAIERGILEREEKMRRRQQ
jgi:hypothetical protein